MGADSLWYKDGDEGTLMQVVRRTMAGEHIFPDAPPSVEIGTAMSAEFTKGEMKVLRCLVRGLSYNEIAKELGIEPSTVKYHVINMLQRRTWRINSSLPSPPPKPNWWWSWQRSNL